MGRFEELLELRKTLRANIFDEEELIELSKKMTDEELEGIDRSLLTYSHSDRLESIMGLLDKLNERVDIILKNK